MGMAASQARFLCLTARKSNTEYQGQQVNQQRTLLANESAGLYNRMLALEVPTPPLSSNYYKTTYQFAPDDSGSGTKYNFTTTPRLVGPNTYQIGVSWDVKEIEVRTKQASITDVADDGLSMKFNGKSVTLTSVNFDDDGYETTDRPDGTELDDDSKRTTMSQEKLGDPDGTKAWFYFEPDGDKGNRYYISEEKLNEIYENIEKGENYQYTVKYGTLVDSKAYSKIYGQLEKSESGRYDKLLITNSPIKDFYVGESDEPIERKLSITEVRDDEAYDEAMKDYEYKKAQYDKEIQDINSQTALIQQKDKSLELKLKQLDTEQEALKNELEAVQEVINKNVESTFKTFSA